jgi:hypothetical protein
VDYIYCRFPSMARLCARSRCHCDTVKSFVFSFKIDWLLFNDFCVRMIIHMGLSRCLWRCLCRMFVALAVFHSRMYLSHRQRRITIRNVVIGLAALFCIKFMWAHSPVDRQTVLFYHIAKHSGLEGGRRRLCIFDEIKSNFIGYSAICDGASI